MWNMIQKDWDGIIQVYGQMTLIGIMILIMAIGLKIWNRFKK